MKVMEKNDASTQISRFSELDGVNLELKLFIVSHGHLLFQTHSLDREQAELNFTNTRFVDCPTKMHKIKLREANESETERVRKLLPSDQARWLKQTELYSIDCQEGSYSIWASTASFKWGGNLINEQLAMILRLPLWEKGPKLEQLLQP